ncbi:MAG: Hsp70 family protein [Myxococcota bacterium]|nr:Hsp70 family protein [Myxococcota bacterium]
MAAIGIDLGTSNSCVAVARRGRVDVLPNAYGEFICPSVVHFAADGSTQVGEPAKAHAIHEPENTIAAAKRLLGRYFFSEEVKKAKAVSSYQIVEGANHAVRIKVREQTLAIPEISAFVLREMKSVAEAQLGQPVTQAVITVPAYFNDNQRQATRDAGKIAGLEVLRLLNEPTAAALAYGFGRGLTQRVAVYDLGGGTFDVSILEIGSDIFEVLSTCGDTFLGGEDFDDRVIDLLADEFASRHKINLRQDRFALEKLKAAAEQAKRDLSIDDEATIRIPDVAQDAEGNALQLERGISRHEFSNLVADLIQRTFKVCDESLQQANLTVRDLDGVILVGGPTRLPLIREAVSQYFQCELKADVDPDQVVAMGAAIHAASLVGDEKDSCLLDVTPLSLRIGVAGGLAETVIDRNTPVPIEQTASFTTFRDFQQSVKIRVYQGESRVQEENELLGEFEFSGFKHARRGEVRIDVTFEIDTDGIVNVTARDPDSGQVASTRIHLSSGLSEAEIQAIVEKHQVTAAEPMAPAGPTAAEAIAALPRRVTSEAAAALPTPEPAAVLAPADAPSLEDDELFAEPPQAEDGIERASSVPDELELATAASDVGSPVGDPEAALGAGAEFDLDLGAGDDSEELELAPPAADAFRHDPGDDGRTRAIGGEIDLEALETGAPSGEMLASDDVDLEPLALDESDLDSLAALADDLPDLPDQASVEDDAMASTRPRQERDQAGASGDDLFGDPGADLSIDPGDAES